MLRCIGIPLVCLPVLGYAGMLGENGPWPAEGVEAALEARTAEGPVPLFRSWTTEVSARGADHVEITLRIRPFFYGGEGEARQVFAHHARALVEEAGCAGFEVVRYEEGLDSSWPLARRFARGEIRLIRSRMFPAL